jgi:MscS family membrane protein
VVRLLGPLALAVVASAGAALAQTVPAASAPVAPAGPEVTRDLLGRSTPRGTVIGFLGAARRGENELARQFLNTRQGGREAEVLAHRLFVVLDARLPARLDQVSDQPEGSRTNPLTPNEEHVGTIIGAAGDVEVVVERVQRAGVGPIWLFSSATLAAVPALYEEVTLERHTAVLPRWLTGTRVGGVALVEWLIVLLGLPILYLLTVLANRLLTPLTAPVVRRTLKDTAFARRGVLPAPARLLLLTLLARWALSALPLSLLLRQTGSSLATLLSIVAVVWLLIQVNGAVEQYIRSRVRRADLGAATSLLHVLRRCADVLVIFVGVIAGLRYFDVDPTPALAGLGVGGIAVALAAQKTLENVIAGASLIFDQAVRVGDFLKMGEVIGTVEHIGLRSTRIRTLDRTVVSIPNSQIASASLETISQRDKYWFHPIVGLRYETTAEQVHAVVDGIRRLLEQHRAVDSESVRVRFFRLGAFSLDVEVFAYVFARDWNHFLEIQEQLLFSVTETVEKAGTAIAFPSQTMYVANSPTWQSAAESVSTS